MIPDPILELGLNDAEVDTLRSHRFDASQFMALRKRLTAGDFPADRNRLTSTVEPPPEDAVATWPRGSELEALAERGRDAIAKGQVAALVLNGGMATRFGGVVKGVVEVLPGQSFLHLKLRDLSRARGDVPVFLMNSFATSEATEEHLATLRSELSPLAIHPVTQGVSLRLNPDGELYRDARGAPSFYAPGHGDVFDVLRHSEGFTRFREGSGRMVMVSNVDNLGATLDPVVVGFHLEHGAAITVEVAAKFPGDKGGAPAKLDGKIQVVEGFRFPNDFDQDRIRVFNTNTLSFDADVFERDVELSWFRADKVVDGHDVVQFERLMGEATATLSSRYLEVEREGDASRFLPIKTPKDLDGLRDAISKRLDL